MKRLILAASLFISCAVYAGSNAPYLGASVGITTNTSSAAKTVDFRGVPLTFFAGYGATFPNSMYVAGEIDVTAATSSIQDNGLRTSYGYSASVLPGVMVTDHALLFARVGLNRAHFSSYDNTASGLLLGLGSQVNVSQNLDLRGEYNFVAHRDVNAINRPRSDTFNLGFVYRLD